MTNEDLFRLTFNAHEFAESFALDAIRAELDKQPIEVLACLADPEWKWQTRSSMSAWIVEQADDLLNAKLDTLVGA